MKPSRTAGACLSSRGVRVLIALPLVLALFALTLQWSPTSTDTAQHLTHSGSGLTVFGDVKVDRARNKELQDRGDYVHGRRASETTTAEKASAGADKPSESARDSKQQKEHRFMAWEPTGLQKDGSKLAFTATTSESLKQIKRWVQYHKAIGVSVFYLFVDGQAAQPDVIVELEKIPGALVVPRDDKLKARHAASRIWNETWLSAFFHKPCNHELFVLQSLNMEVAIERARADGVDWLLHIDTDELMYPGGAGDYSLQRVLDEYPDDVDTVVFPNYEALPENSDVADPFTEVTLFKRNYAHVMSENYFKSYHSVSRGNPNYFITYGNGKSAARVMNGLRPNGAHRWYNYFKAPKEETAEQAAVLHFTYNRFQDLKSRRDRCDCAPTEEDAKRCFILPFDRMAFLAASLKTDEELMTWFNERLVWNDVSVINDLLKNGLFLRIFMPQVLIKGFAAAEEANLQSEAVAVNALQSGGQELIN